MNSYKIKLDQAIHCDFKFEVRFNFRMTLLQFHLVLSLSKHHLNYFTAWYWGSYYRILKVYHQSIQYSSSTPVHIDLFHICLCIFVELPQLLGDFTNFLVCNFNLRFNNLFLVCIYISLSSMIYFLLYLCPFFSKHVVRNYSTANSHGQSLVCSIVTARLTTDKMMVVT